MKRIHAVLAAAVSVAALGGSVTQAGADTAPAVNSAVIRARIFNDDSDSILSFTDNYPSLIRISDDKLDGDGMGGEFANLHNWRFSEDDVTQAVFSNGDRFTFSSDLVISGTGDGEAGLQIAPWWAQDVDGRLNVRTTFNGEIAAFGGRLPFFSFTGTFGVTYTKGETISLGMDYKPNGLSSADPATVEYMVTVGGTDYTSGPLAFDQGNPAEPFGLWGILNDARVGGHFQPFIDVGNPNSNLTAEWTNITFSIPEPASAAMALVGLGGLLIRRRLVLRSEAPLRKEAQRGHSRMPLT